MIDEGKAIAQVNKGAAADAELRVLGTTFQELRAEYGKAWEASGALDTAGREKLWLATTILTKVEAALRAHVANGKIAQSDIDVIRQAGEPKPTALREFRRA